MFLGFLVHVTLIMIIKNVYFIEHSLEHQGGVFLIFSGKIHYVKWIFYKLKDLRRTSKNFPYK